MRPDMFNYIDYKLLILQLIESYPKKGRGQLQKIALHLGVHPTFMSQVLKAQKNLGQDQAFLLSEYLGFSPLETEFFMALVQYERAGNHRLKKHLKLKLNGIRVKAKEIKNVLPDNKELKEEDKARFYSDVLYSIVRM